MSDTIILEGEMSLSQIIDGDVDLTLAEDGDIGVFMPIQPILENNKTVSPTEQTQTVTPSPQFNGMRQVIVNAIPSDYVGSAIVHDPAITINGPTVNVPEGYYTNDNAVSVQTAEQAVPTITINGADITASATQTEGYVASGTKQTTATIPAVEQAEPVLSVSNTGLITATAVQNSGFVTDGTKTVTEQLLTQAGTTITPTESQQTAVDSGKYTTGTVRVDAIPSNYVGSAIAHDPTPTVSGATVNIPTGYYSQNTTATVSTGTAGTPTATKGAVVNNSVTVTPSVINSAGYISGGTITGTAVSVSASELVSGTLQITQNGQADITNYQYVDVDVSGGGGGPLIMGVIRPDAELVQKWTYDKMMYADEGISLPAYNSGSQTTLIPTATLATYDGTPLTYRYLVAQRTLLIPQYNIATLAKGREDHAYSSCVHEWVYEPANQIKTVDGTKTYGQYSLMVGNGPNTRLIYWSSATAITPYTATSYGLALTMQAPTIGSNKTITIKSPTLTVRGHATYFAQTFWEAVTDARMQYIIELWRVPITQGVINGWVHTSQYDSIENDVNNNNADLR